MSKKTTRISPFLKQCFVTGAVCSNVIGHGCMMGFPGILLPQVQDPESTLKLTLTERSWVASVMSLSLIGANFITPPIMGKLGRKIAHYCVTVPALAGWLTIIMANSFQLIIISRILHGLSVGMLLPLRSVLVGEYTSAKNRGAFLTTVTLAQAFGIFFVHLVGSLLSWQKTALISVIFSIASLLMTIYSPESPSWLATKGRYEECQKVFRWLRGDNEEKELDEMIQARMLQEKHNISKGEIGGCSESLRIIKKREFTRPIIVMITFYMSMNFGGGTVMASYATKLIGLIAGPSVNPHFWMTALDTMRLVTTVMAVFVINKVKRRTITFAAVGLCIFSQFSIAALVYTRNHGIFNGGGVWLPLLLLNIQIFSVSTGIIPLTGVIAGEIFPIEYSSIGGGISLHFSTCFMFLVLKTLPDMLEWIGVEGTYCVFATGLVLCLIIIGVLLPETKGKTLTEIEDELRGRRLKPEEIEFGKSLQSNPEA